VCRTVSLKLLTVSCSRKFTRISRSSRKNKLELPFINVNCVLTEVSKAHSSFTVRPAWSPRLSRLLYLPVDPSLPECVLLF
jgi:hypothetical protein